MGIKYFKHFMHKYRPQEITEGNKENVGYIVWLCRQMFVKNLKG